jgi:hypothetical protein
MQAGRREAAVGFWASVLITVFLVGCGDSARPDASMTECGDGPGVVRLGEGGPNLRPLPTSGGELTIVLGAQGGIHVLVGFSVSDMDLEMRVTYTLTEAGTGEAIGTTEVALRPTLFSTEMGQTVRNPDLVVLDNENPSVDVFAGRRAILSLEAVSTDSHACDSREITLIAPD